MIVVPKVALAVSSEASYHRYSCPACDRANVQHESKGKRSNTGTWVTMCPGCKREVHVQPAPPGGLIVL